MASHKDQSPDADRSQSPGPECLRASPRLFENPLLDKLSRVHWSMPLIFYMPFVAFLAWLSFNTLRPVTVGCAALLGYMIWTLTEYFGHRYLFHAEFPGTWGARIHLLIHGVHHDHPNDPLRLVMPPLLSAPIMLAALLVGRVLFGFPLAYPVLMGFMLGYLIYDMVHYYVHHAEPKTRLGRSLRRVHMLHHFRDPERGFGVSAPWWDKVFRTEHLPARQDGRR
jgi:dihydroceramide fatty acyl 2-hydroxylase